MYYKNLQKRWENCFLFMVQNSLEKPDKKILWFSFFLWFFRIEIYVREK